VVAQLGTPDMRVPIAYGLAWPERMDSRARRRSTFRALPDLSFEPIDGDGHRERYPGLAWPGRRCARARHLRRAERRQRGRGGRLPGAGASASTRSTPSTAPPWIAVAPEAKPHDLPALLDLDARARAAALSRRAAA
jgi:1-deoxy-D-xylulose-5-phosphate reductoisomerase